MTDAERDRAAEEWLMDRHGCDWYLGQGTAEEWAEAYGSVDARAAADDLVLADLLEAIRPMNPHDELVARLRAAAKELTALRERRAFEVAGQLEDAAVTLANYVEWRSSDPVGIPLDAPRASVPRSGNGSPASLFYDPTSAPPSTIDDLDGTWDSDRAFLRNVDRAVPLTAEETIRVWFRRVTDRYRGRTR